MKHLFLQTLDEALKKNAGNTHPHVICVGDHSTIFSSVAVCDKCVITSEIGHFVFSAILTLIAISYTYSFSYNPITQQVLEFLQEVVGDCLLSTKWLSVAFTNLSRAITCIEQRRSEDEHEEGEEQSEQSEDATQAYCDFD